MGDKYIRKFLCNSEENRTNSFRVKFFERFDFGEEEPKLHAEKLKINPTLNTKYSAVLIQKTLKLI